MTAPDFAAIADRITQINHQTSELAEEKAALVNLLLTELEPGSKTPAGDFTISIGKPVQRLSTTRIMLAYPVTEAPHLYKPTVDTAKVKQHFSPAQLTAEGLYDESAPRVTIQ